MPSRTLCARLLLAATAAAAALVLAGAVHRFWWGTPPPESVELVDVRERLDRLLKGRTLDPEDLLPKPLDGERADVLREPLSLNTARLFFPQAGMSRPFNQEFYFSRAPNLEVRVPWPEHPNGEYVMRTNALGMREDEEVDPFRPDLRILVTGDSHTDGICANSESFCNRLEARLAAEDGGRTVEALNAAAGGYNFYNYLGVLEHYRYLEPHVFVMAVYGGNDFHAMVALHAYFHRRPPPVRRRPGVAELLGDDTRPRGIGAQELAQVLHFADNPDDVQVAIDTATKITREIDRLARKSSIRTVCVYLPPPLRGQPRLFAQETRELLARVGVEEHDLAVSDRIADAWLSALRAAEIPTLDLRPLFRADEERLYYERDCHIDVRAHERIAEALAATIGPLIDDLR